MAVEPPIDLLQRLHASGWKLVYEFTGAGSLALAWMHGVGGSSRTILEATDRYAAASLADLLGQRPDKSVCAATAAAMAAAAHLRALHLAGEEHRCLGVGCTASIATDYAKRGQHACFVAVHDGRNLRNLGLVLRKGARDRPAEECLVALLVLRAIAQVLVLGRLPPLDLLADEQLLQEQSQESDAVSLLLHAAVRWVVVHPDSTMHPEETASGVILSGSFHPLHEGHERLAAAAGRLLERPVFFELPIVNADKPPLHKAEILRRLAQFRGKQSVLLSRSPLFVDKSALFPDSVFVVGFDTAQRLLAPPYYGGLAQRDAALAQVASNGCRFIVAGRWTDGQFRRLGDLQLPAGLRDLFVELPDFRCDVSSTALRGGG